MVNHLVTIAATVSHTASEKPIAAQ